MARPGNSHRSIARPPAHDAAKLARYWATEYDWRNVEARLNGVSNFITEIDHLDIHFIHVRSKHKNALPLIVTSGQTPSTVATLTTDCVEFCCALNPSRFDVVVGFPHRTGLR